MNEYVVDEIKVEAKENQYGWSCAILSGDKFIWVNGDVAKNLSIGDSVKGVLVPKKYFKDGEEKISYSLKDENSKAVKEMELISEFNKLAKRVVALEDVVFGDNAPEEDSKEEVIPFD